MPLFNDVFLRPELLDLCIGYAVSLDLSWSISQRWRKLWRRRSQWLHETQILRLLHNLRLHIVPPRTSTSPTTTKIWHRDATESNLQTKHTHLRFYQRINNVHFYSTNLACTSRKSTNLKCRRKKQVGLTSYLIQWWCKKLSNVNAKHSGNWLWLPIRPTLSMAIRNIPLIWHTASPCCPLSLPACIRFRIVVIREWYLGWDPPLVYNRLFAFSNYLSLRVNNSVLLSNVLCIST